MADENTPIDPAPAAPRELPKKADPFVAAQERATLKTAKSAAKSDETSLPDLKELEKPEKVQPVRGGVGLLTVLMMSTLSMAGGAYLALFAQGRPDLVRSSGLAAILPPTAAPKPADADSLKALSSRLDGVALEIAALKSRLNGISPAPLSSGTTLAAGASSPSAVDGAQSAALADLSGLSGQLNGVSGRVTAIETRLAALDPTGAGGAVIAGLQADIATLKVIVANLQQQAAAAPSAAVTFAVVNLSEAAGRSAPFMPEFETLRAALPGVPEVAALEAYARTGVPTRQLLVERFNALGPAVASAQDPSKDDVGFVKWIRALMADMVKVQAAPTATGTGGQAVLVRAKTLLEQGDLSAALAEVRTITPQPAQVSEWIAGAQKRLELESRIAAVRGAVERGARPNAPQVVTTSAAAPPALAPAPAAIPAVPPPSPKTPSEAR